MIRIRAPYDRLFAFILSLSFAVPAFSSLRSEPLVLFIIDFSDFMCPTCLNSLLYVCEALPVHIVEENVRGIVVLPKETAALQEKNTAGIFLKKIRGFKKANQIRFPLILDKDSLFKAVAENGSCLLLLDMADSTIIRFSLPLSQKSLNQLLERLAEEGRAAFITRERSLIIQPLFVHNQICPA